MFDTLFSESSEFLLFCSTFQHFAYIFHNFLVFFSWSDGVIYTPLDVVHVLEICPNYASDMPKICPRYACIMPNIYTRYAQDLSKICGMYA